MSVVVRMLVLQSGLEIRRQTKYEIVRQGVYLFLFALPPSWLGTKRGGVVGDKIVFVRCCQDTAQAPGAARTLPHRGARSRLLAACLTHARPTPWLRSQGR